jgi:hypothetical protein
MQHSYNYTHMVTFYEDILLFFIYDTVLCCVEGAGVEREAAGVHGHNHHRRHHKRGRQQIRQHYPQVKYLNKAVHLSMK